jgi:hypothetical protein
VFAKSYLNDKQVAEKVNFIKRWRKICLDEEIDKLYFFFTDNRKAILKIVIKIYSFGDYLQVVTC